MIRDGSIARWTLLAMIVCLVAVCGTWYMLGRGTVRVTELRIDTGDLRHILRGLRVGWQGQRTPEPYRSVLLSLAEVVPPVPPCWVPLPSTTSDVERGGIADRWRSRYLGVAAWADIRPSIARAILEDMPKDVYGAGSSPLYLEMVEAVSVNGPLMPADGDVERYFVRPVWRQSPGVAAYLQTKGGRYQTVRPARDPGLEPEARDGLGWTALHYAALDGSREELALLLSQGLNVDGANYGGYTPLHLATIGGKLAAMEDLLEAGADVNAEGGNGWTPLHWAAAGSSPAAVETLLAGGARANSLDGEGLSPLHFAALAASAASAELLLAAGAETDIAGTDEVRMTPLHLAALRGSPEVAVALLEAGAFADSRDAEGRTPLHIAASWGHVRTCEVLLAAGADPGLRDDSGQTPLDVAIEVKADEIERMLRSYLER